MAGDPRLAIGPDLIDRLARLEAELRDIQASTVGASVLGTDQTIKGSHDRLDAILGAGGTGDYLELTEIAAPADPAADKLRIYARDDGAGTTKFYYRRSDGTEIELGGGSSGVTEMWFPSYTAELTGGSYSWGITGPGNTKSRYLVLADGVTTAYAWTFCVPQELAGVEMTFTAYYEGSGSGNFRIRYGENTRAQGDNMGTGTENTYAETVAVATGLRIYTFASTFTLGAAGDIHRVHFARLGADGADTSTGVIWLYGVRLKRA